LRAGTAELAGPQNMFCKNLEYIISPICLNLCRAENSITNKSADEHLKNPKTSWGSQLHLEVSILAKTLDFYLVTQTL
jgi:hypothetical protein